MDKVIRYRHLIHRILEEYGRPSRTPGVETQLIMDEARDHYLLIDIGWRGNERVRGCIIHLDIKDGRIWVQYDGTEAGVASELVDLGVPREDIVLGFRAPYRRPDTGFSTAVEPGLSAE